MKPASHRLLINNQNPPQWREEPVDPAKSLNPGSLVSEVLGSSRFTSKQLGLNKATALALWAASV